MKKQNSGFTTVELVVVVVIILIIATISIPAIARTLAVYRTRAAAETLAQQLNSARQAAITIGRRSQPAAQPLIALYMLPATGSRGVGFWFDRNNSGIDPTSTPPPDTEIIYIAQGIRVGNDVGGSPQCTTSVGVPFEIARFNTRGELALNFTPNACLQNGGNPVNVWVETVRGTTPTSRYLVGVSLRGSVSVGAR